MRPKPAKFHKGLEFYRSVSTGLTGIANDEDGNQSTYTNLTDDEARAWLSAWLKGERWVRSA